MKMTFQESAHEFFELEIWQRVKYFFSDQLDQQLTLY